MCFLNEYKPEFSTWPGSATTDHMTSGSSWKHGKYCDFKLLNVQLEWYIAFHKVEAKAIFKTYNTVKINYEFQYVASRNSEFYR